MYLMIICLKKIMNLIEPRFMLKFIRNFAGLETKKMKTFLLDSINKY